MRGKTRCKVLIAPQKNQITGTINESIGPVTHRFISEYLLRLLDEVEGEPVVLAHQTEDLLEDVRQREEVPHCFLQNSGAD